MGRNHIIFQNNKLWVALVLFVIAGVGFMLLSTRFGAFLGDDSYYYIEAARAALQGNGFNPSPFFAPLLSAVLVLLGWLGIEPLIAIRYLHAFLFGFSILLTWIIAKQADISDLFAGLVALLVLLSDVLLEMYGNAMSEALYMTLLLAAVLLLADYLKRPTYLRLVFAAVTIALACLTRYAALAAVPALVIGLIIYDDSHPFINRVWRSCIYTVVSLVPLGVYLVRNILVSGLATRYVSFEIPPLTVTRLTWYLYNTLSWFIPGRLIKGREIIAGILFIILLAAAIVVYLKIRRKTSNQSGIFPAVITVWIAFIVVNFLMLLLAGGLIGLIADNSRYLAPILWALLFIIGYFLDRLWKTGNRFLIYAIPVFCLVFVVYYGVRTYDYLSNTYHNGLGYYNHSWHNSETVAYLKDNPDIKVVSTGEMGIYFWTGKRPALITDFGGVTGLRQYLCQTGDYLLIMNQMPAEIYHLDQAEVVQGLNLVRTFNDSSMYQCLAP